MPSNAIGHATGRLSWARERNRLRQFVLEQEGWRIRGIWNADWFYNRESEMHKLLDAIERARSGRDCDAKPVPPAKPLVIDRSEPVPEPESTRIQYEEASFAIPESSCRDIHEMAASTLDEYVVKIISPAAR